MSTDAFVAKSTDVRLDTGTKFELPFVVLDHSEVIQPLCAPALCNDIGHFYMQVSWSFTLKASTTGEPDPSLEVKFG